VSNADGAWDPLHKRGELTLHIDARWNEQCLHAVRGVEQAIDVPSHPLIPPQMPYHPLFQAAHGRADVHVRSMFEAYRTERSHLDVAVRGDRYQQEVCSPRSMG